PGRGIRAPARDAVAGSQTDTRRDAGSAAVADRRAVGDSRDDESAAEPPGCRHADEARRAAHRAADAGPGAAGRASARRAGADADDAAEYLAASRDDHRVVDE